MLTENMWILYVIPLCSLEWLTVSGMEEILYLFHLKFILMLYIITVVWKLPFLLSCKLLKIIINVLKTCKNEGMRTPEKYVVGLERSLFPACFPSGRLEQNPCGNNKPSLKVPVIRHCISSFLRDSQLTFSLLNF